MLDGMDGWSRKILQDGCPCQNSRKTFQMMEQQNVAVFAIPARLPDLNPIENLFNQVKYQYKRRPISFCVFNWRCDKKIHKYWFVYFPKIRYSMLSVATWKLYTQLSFTKPPLNNIPPWGILRETITLLPTANYFGSACSIYELHLLLLQFWCWKNEVF